MSRIKNALIIDDCPIDSFLNEKALAKFHEDIRIRTINLPVEALAYLKSIYALSLKKQLALKPDVVFLDIHMPKMDGFEILDELERNQAFMQNPVDIYVLSSSCRTYDIETAMNKKLCKGYITKPLNDTKLNDLFG
ncbi:response regulator [Muriicola sp. Z0-33]|uniref:response regulator n=1 Tax=Muriicola sp. Z0-33 TaxID=2816957 RepID=UPI002238665C|nr:response regulator [Muriicola sp. Z0-33]MCW5516907.1 response regulator [Muriicola sp. Z0-33]